MSYMIKPDKTFASFDLVISDIRRLCRFLDIFVNVLFLLLYVHAIITSIDRPILFTVNIVLLVISLAYFIAHAFTFKGSNGRYEKIVNLHVARGVRYFKILVKLFTLGLSLYELLYVSYSDLQLIILAVTAVAFLLQVIFEIGRFLFEGYFAIIKTGIMMDLEELQATTAYKAVMKIADGVQNPKAFFAEGINNRIEALRSGKNENADAEEEKKKPRLERKIESHAERLTEAERERAAADSAAKEARAAAAVSALKESLKGIFKRKKP